MKIILFTFFVSFMSLHALAIDESGYWDYARAVEKKIPLEDQSKTWISINIPTGTTQILYRVSFISPNTEIRASLSSTLASIPSGTTQGAAAAIKLIDKIGGDNEGWYLIFKSKTDADDFHNNGNTQNACYKSAKGIPSEKNYMLINENSCINTSNLKLYFAVQNDNVVDDVQVIIELVPWIDYTASRGWTKDNKSKFLSSCMEKYSDVTDPGTLCTCVLNKLEENYKISDFSSMLESEVNLIVESYASECKIETGEVVSEIQEMRDSAMMAEDRGNYSLALDHYKKIIISGQANYFDNLNIGCLYINTKQYLKAIKYLKIAESLDETELFVKLKLSHAYLFNGEMEKAKEFHIRYKDQNISEDYSWINQTKDDFEFYKRIKLNSENFDVILELLK